MSLLSLDGLSSQTSHCMYPVEATQALRLATLNKRCGETTKVYLSLGSTKNQHRDLGGFLAK